MKSMFVPSSCDSLFDASVASSLTSDCTFDYHPLLSVGGENEQEGEAEAEAELQAQADAVDYKCPGPIKSMQTENPRESSLTASVSRLTSILCNLELSAPPSGTAPHSSALSFTAPRAAPKTVFISNIKKIFKSLVGTKAPESEHSIAEKYTSFATELPLETFKNRNTDQPLSLLTITLNGKSTREREERFNPNYLKHYAIVQRIQDNNYSSISEEELDIFDEFLLDCQHHIDNNHHGIDFERLLYTRLSNSLCWQVQRGHLDSLTMEYLIELKFMSLARHKLWSTMTLPVRSDALPSIRRLTDDIIPRRPSDTVLNRAAPWVSMKDLLKTNNMLGFGLNGNQKIQYTLKNVKSKRFEEIVFADC